MHLIRIPVLVATSDENMPKMPISDGILDILEDRPSTWEAYPDTPTGAFDIVSMEYKEMVEAKGTKNFPHEVEHLLAAALNLWQKIHVTK